MLINNRMGAFAFVAAANTVARDLIKRGAQNLNIERDSSTGRTLYTVCFDWAPGRKFWV